MKPTRQQRALLEFLIEILNIIKYVFFLGNKNNMLLLEIKYYTFKKFIIIFKIAKTTRFLSDCEGATNEVAPLTARQVKS